MKILKILILEANPHKDLSLNEEIRDLEDAIQRSHDRDLFEIKTKLAVRSTDLQESILRFEPNILHFCGHGTGEEGLVFLDKKISTDAISTLFALCKEHLQCIVLNACYSEVQADEIVKHINYVIGMKQAIRDDAAIAFSLGFYRALGYEKTIEDAFEWGKNAIQLTIDNGSRDRSAITEKIRKLKPIDEISETIITQEHLKPILKKKESLIPWNRPPDPLTKALKEIIDRNNLYERAKQAYYQCRPKNWLDSVADSLSKILLDLKEFPDDENGYHPILKFTALLTNDSQLSEPICDQFKKLGESHAGDYGLDPSKFEEMCKSLKTTSQSDYRSYLMVQIRPSQQNSDRYFVEAWFIPNSSEYQSDTGSGCQYLDLEEKGDKAYLLEEIPVVIQELLNLSGNYIKDCPQEPIIEFFLSTDLLNQDIDCWEIEDSDNLFVPIGFEYQVVVRSYERLLPRYYRHLPVWKQKWDNLKQFGDTVCADLFVSGDKDWRELMVQLESESVFGVMLTKAPDLGKGSPISVIQRTATPIAVWTRSDLENIDSQEQIKELLQCLVNTLRLAVQEKRKNAFVLPRDRDLGHHLSLLWEDPYRLPPKICYLAS